MNDLYDTFNILDQDHVGHDSNWSLVKYKIHKVQGIFSQWISLVH